MRSASPNRSPYLTRPAVLLPRAIHSVLPDHSNARFAGALDLGVARRISAAVHFPQRRRRARRHAPPAQITAGTGVDTLEPGPCIVDVLATYR